MQTPEAPYLWAAAAPPPAEPNPLVTLAMFAGLFLFMYFLIIRPQRKRQKEHRELVENLQKGDEVVMSCGLVGRIVRLDGDYLELEAADGVRLKFQKVAVHAVLPKGTLKSA
ncbi:MAG: preprotein translocase subunit YajC [Porticoccaceae bacterium]|nr:MAG: preprotein translocase subunit YajC [Porticoccaceae bacterium]